MRNSSNLLCFCFKGDASVRHGRLIGNKSEMPKKCIAVQECTWYGLCSCTPSSLYPRDLRTVDRASTQKKETWYSYIILYIMSFMLTQERSTQY